MQAQRGPKEFCDLFKKEEIVEDINEIVDLDHERIEEVVAKVSLITHLFLSFMFNLLVSSMVTILGVHVFCFQETWTLFDSIKLSLQLMVSLQSMVLP